MGIMVKESESHWLTWRESLHRRCRSFKPIGATLMGIDGYDSGISNWLWLYGQNMTCKDECEFGHSLDVVVGGEFGPADFIYMTGVARNQTFVAVDRPSQSDAMAITLPNGQRAIQIQQAMESISYTGKFEFSCPASYFTPYSANRFTLHATFCEARVEMSRRWGSTAVSEYNTGLALIELEVSWLAGVGLLNQTSVGPFPARPYPTRLDAQGRSGTQDINIRSAQIDARSPDVSNPLFA